MHPQPGIPRHCPRVAVLSFVGYNQHIRVIRRSLHVFSSRAAPDATALVVTSVVGKATNKRTKQMRTLSTSSNSRSRNESFYAFKIRTASRSRHRTTTPILSTQSRSMTRSGGKPNINKRRVGNPRHVPGTARQHDGPHDLYVPWVWRTLDGLLPVFPPRVFIGGNVS